MLDKKYVLHLALRLGEQLWNPETFQKRNQKEKLMLVEWILRNFYFSIGLLSNSIVIIYRLKNDAETRSKKTASGE